MMSCIQITGFQLYRNFTNLNHWPSDSSALCVSPPQQLQPQKAVTNLAACSSSYLGLKVHATPGRLTICTPGFKQSRPVCLFGGKGKAENDAEGSPWKALEKAMSNLKEPSVEEMLRQQIQKQEFFDDGGSGGKDTGSGGGGGNEGDGLGSGESDDESLSGILDETIQVILATLGFVFLYMFIIEGEEIATFSKDIIRFVFTRRKSIRLTRFVDNWARFFRELSPTEDSDPNWLAREIINTPAWFDSPTKYRSILRRYMSSGSY